MGWIIAIAVNAFALWAAVWLVPGLDFTGEPLQFAIVAAVFAALNTLLKPVLKIVTIPISLITFGLFLFVINALMLLITGTVSDELNLGFTVADFGAAFLGGIVTAFAGFVAALIADRVD
jgi:putative membrane protein